MLNKYNLLTKTQNMSGGEETKVSSYDTYKQAESAWRDALSKVGGNPQTAYMVAEIIDPYGRTMNPYTVDNTPEPLYTIITDIDATAEDGVTYYVLINDQYVADTGVSVGDRVYGKYVVAE